MAATLPTGRELRGPRLVARPFTEQDCADLALVLMDERVYAHGYVMHHRPVTPDDAARMARNWITPDSLDGKGQGRLSYCFRLADDCDLGPAGTFVGSSSLGEVNLEREQLHLGWTIYAPAFWGSGTNAEAKWLLLREVFEGCGMGRVKIQTDILNTRSQAAIARLGATREGVLRRDQPREDGTWRDTVVFSILADEWPRVEQGLLARLPTPPM